MDRTLSLQLGRSDTLDRSGASRVPRPLAVDDQHPETVQLPEERSRLSLYVHSLQLHELMGSAVTIAKELENKHFSNPTNQYSIFFGDSDMSYLTSILALDRSLLASPYQGPRVHASTSEECNLRVKRQAGIARVGSLHCRILLFRHVLARLCRVMKPSVGNAGADRTLPQHLALSCSTICLQAACETISTFCDNTLFQLGFGHVPTYCNPIYYIYTAATVLQAARLNHAVAMSVGDESIQTSWNDAIEFLKAMPDVGTLVQRSVAALELLAYKVSHTLSTIDPPGKEPPTTTADVGGDESVEETPAGEVVSAVEQLEAACAQTPEMRGDHLSDFGIDMRRDMSWLTSVPADL